MYHRHNTTLRAYVRRKFLAAYWKVLLAQRHPGRLVQDSHTPQTVKLQMGLAGILVGAVLGGLIGWLARGLVGESVSGWVVNGALALAALAVALFAASSLPFLAKVWRRDRAIMLPALGLAVGAGAGAGDRICRRADALPRPRSGASRPDQRPAARGQRLLDLSLGTLTLLVISPVMAAVALAIKLDRPVQSFSARCASGKTGGLFDPKFRTMVADAEARLPQVVDLAALPAPAFKLRNDPASPASAASCAAGAWTSCRSWSTCCAAR